MFSISSITGFKQTITSTEYNMMHQVFQDTILKASNQLQLAQGLSTSTPDHDPSLPSAHHMIFSYQNILQALVPSKLSS